MADQPDPTYGNWRKPHSPGLGQLGTGGTVLLFVGLIVATIGFMFDLLVGLVIVVLLILMVVPLTMRDRWGRNGYELVTEQVSWLRHRQAKRNLYGAGPLSRTPVTRAQLPGLAARLETSEAFDAHGRPFVVLHHPRTGHVATVIEASPSGDALVDSDHVNQWVAGWGAWLANLAHEAGIVAAQVTVETAPDTGVRLRRSVESRLTADAPALAVGTMQEIVDTYPGGSPSTACRIALTWTRARAGARRRSVEDMAVEIGSRLPELCGALGSTGAGSARPMSLAELAVAVRGAYDPDVAQALDEVGPVITDDAGTTATVEWDDAGPLSAEEHRGHYVHDGAVSVSWAMGLAPRGAVRHSVLRRLLAPHPEVKRKRVTLLYRPYSPDMAAQLVDQDVLNARFQATQRRVARARDSVEIRAAEKAAQEEAIGAGLVRFGMVVTATTSAKSAEEMETVDRMVSVMEHLGSASKTSLRRAWRSQATTFTAGLPLGLVLPGHVAMPEAWRDRI